MTTLQLTIDARPARQGAREFARSAEEIRRVANAAQAAVEAVDGAFRRLRESAIERPGRGGGLLTVASTPPSGLQATTSQGGGGAPDLRSAIDSLADISDFVADALEILGEGDSKLARLAGRFGLIGLGFGLVIDAIDAAIEELKTPKPVSESLQEFKKLNDLFAQARVLAEEVPSAFRPIFEDLSQRLETLAVQEVRNITGTFSSAAANARNRQIGFGNVPPETLQKFEEARNALGEIFRISAIRQVTEEIRKAVEGTNKSLLEGAEPPIEPRPLAIQPRGALVPGTDPFVPAAPRTFDNGALDGSDGIIAEIGDEIERLPPVFAAATQSALDWQGSTLAGLDDTKMGYAEVAAEVEEALGGTIAETLEDNLRTSRDFADGAISAFEAYAKAATDAGQQAQDLVTKSLRGMEAALVGFVRTGKLEFKSLVDAILADLARIVVQQGITGPLSRAFAGLFGGSTSSLSGNFAVGSSFPSSGVGSGFTLASFAASQHGNAFDRGRLIALARGGVVDRPTFFPLARGAGLMGEAGPEAVLPLKRLPGGDLGVRGERGGGVVNNITVVNEAGAEVETSEQRNPTGGVDSVIRLFKRDMQREIEQGGPLARSILALTGASQAPVRR